MISEYSLEIIKIAELVFMQKEEALPIWLNNVLLVHVLFNAITIEMSTLNPRICPWINIELKSISCSHAGIKLNEFFSFINPLVAGEMLERIIGKLQLQNLVYKLHSFDILAQLLRAYHRQFCDLV